MTNHGVQVHPDHGALLQERQRILNEADVARGQAARLRELGGQVPQGDRDPDATSGPISQPVPEVVAAVNKLQQAIAEIDQCRGEIRVLENEISAIRARAQNLKLLLIVAVMAILLGIGFMISAYR